MKAWIRSSAGQTRSVGGRAALEVIEADVGRRNGRSTIRASEHLDLLAQLRQNAIGGAPAVADRVGDGPVAGRQVARGENDQRTGCVVHAPVLEPPAVRQQTEIGRLPERQQYPVAGEAMQAIADHRAPATGLVGLAELDLGEARPRRRDRRRGSRPVVADG